MSAPSKPHRVLHVAFSLGMGGTEKAMQLMVTHLDRERFFPAVWTASDGPRGEMLRESGVPVIVGKGLEEAAVRFAPDIVHVHRAGWPQPETLRPLRASFRPDPDRRVERLPRIIETNVFGRHDPSATGRMLDVTLLVSHFCAERMRVVNGLPVAPPRYNVLYNPVDTDAFARFCPDPATRDYTRPVYGRLSRADPGKWSALALESLPLVREAVPDFLFLVVGGTDQARTYVAEHGLDNHVRFLPPVLSDQELAEFFNTLRFMAHANDTGESFGLVIAEAMAAGLPVVTHACPGWKDNAQLELVRHEETGLVADSVRSYADAIIRLLRDPGECRRMGAAGRKRAQKLFRAQTIARQLGAVYEEALGLKPPNVPVEGRP